MENTNSASVGRAVQVASETSHVSSPSHPGPNPSLNNTQEQAGSAGDLGIGWSTAQGNKDEETVPAPHHPEPHPPNH